MLVVHRLWRVGLALSWVAVGCGSPPPPAPSAVIVVAPSAVCAGDDHQTEIVIHARDSQSRLTLVPVAPEPSAPPLAIHWSFSGAEHRIVDEDPDRQQVVLTIAGDRPLHVRLRVRNADGGEAIALTTVGITPPDSESGVCVGSP